MATVDDKGKVTAIKAVTVLGEKMTQRLMKSGKSDENQKSCDTNRAKSDTALFFSISISSTDADSLADTSYNSLEYNLLHL